MGLVEGNLVVTSIEAALLAVGLLSVSITLLHRKLRASLTLQRNEIGILQQTGQGQASAPT